jgi:hypothetical protein
VSISSGLTAVTIICNIVKEEEKENELSSKKRKKKMNEVLLNMARIYHSWTWTPYGQMSMTMTNIFG